MINSELQRLLWTNFSLPRLVMALVMLFIMVLLSNGMEGPIMLNLYRLVMFLISIQIMQKTLQADHRYELWEQQRLSAISPNRLLWGKSVGFLWEWSLYYWISTLFYLQLRGDSATFMMQSMVLYLGGVFLHLHLMRALLRYQRYSSLIVLLLAFWIFYYASTRHWLDQPPVIVWYGSMMTSGWWALITLMMMIGLTLLMIWNLIRQELMIMMPPWTTLASYSILLIYLLGFFPEGDRAEAIPSLLLIFIVMLYYQWWVDPFSITIWNRCIGFYRAKRYHLFLCSLPSWFITILFTLVGLSLLALSSPLFSGVLFMIVLRDGAMVMAIRFWSLTNRKASQIILSYFLVLLIIIPWLLGDFAISFFNYLSPHLALVRALLEGSEGLALLEQRQNLVGYTLLLSFTLQSIGAVGVMFYAWRKRNHAVRAMTRQMAE